ncbi:unnamed protein product, partial [Leptidea sinapis]
MLYHLYDTSPLTMTFHSAPRFWSSEPPSAPQYTPGVSTGSEESLICCIPLLLTPNEVAFIILHFLAGITQAGLFIIIPVYVKEISPKQSRGSMVSLMMMLIPLGYLSRLVLNKEEMMYTMTALKAKINIAKLKCLTEEDSSVLNELNRLRDESERAKSNGNLTILRILQNKIWLDSMKIGFVLYSVTILCGSVIFLDQNKTLIQLKTQTDPKNILIPLSMFTGGTTTVVLIKFFERKYLLTFGYALMVLSMGVLAVFTQADLTVTSTRWLPVTSLGILVFAYGMVWALPIDLMGVHALFYTFAGINLLAAVYCVMAVPDIKDKSTKQIEQQLKRIPILKITHRLWNSNSKDNPLPSIFIDQKAKINIAKLKCLTEEDSSVLNELNRLRDESERAKSNGNLTILRILQNKIWLDSMKIGFVLYSNKTLIQLKTQTNPKNILIPLSMFTGGTTTVVLINFFERKYLLTFGYALMVVSMGVVAVFTQADLTVTSTRWLPVTSLGILVFAYGMVWALPIDLMGVHALFYTFAGINLLAVVYCLMAVPDIKDKTTKQIEQQLKRIPILKM